MQFFTLRVSSQFIVVIIVSTADCSFGLLVLIRTKSSGPHMVQIRTAKPNNSLKN